MEKVHDIKIDEEIEMFGLLSILIKSFRYKDFSKREAKRTLNKFNIPEEKFIKLLDKLIEKRTIRKCNILYDILDMLRIKSSPPVIILNKEEFRNFIIQGLNEITLKIVKKREKYGINIENEKSKYIRNNKSDENFYKSFSIE